MLNLIAFVSLEGSSGYIKGTTQEVEGPLWLYDHWVTMLPSLTPWNSSECAQIEPTSNV